jgi:nucleotide-binding universal stress UspA family protein
MADRILVPLDGSARAERILTQVERLLRREDAEVVLLHVSELAYSLARMDTAKLAKEERQTSSAYLKSAAEGLESRGIRARALQREGAVADGILRAANEVRATLIAMSTHGRTGLARFFLGSVAEKVLRGAPVPVLLLRSFAGGATSAPPFRRILVPVDGSKTSARVIPAAADLARLFDADVTVLSVAVAVEPDATASEEAREEAEKVAARFQERGARARAMTAAGDPAAAILDTAEAEKADLIAMATHGWTGLTRWMLGSVTEKVLRHANLPMLVVRPERA